jgi:hypothetical protein
MTLLSSLLSVFRRHASPALARRGRISFRLVMNEPVRFAPGAAANGQVFSGILEDLSATGACLRSHQKISPGEPISLFMSFGQDLHFDLPGSIVYCRPESSGFQFRYGVHFAGLALEESARIAGFVEEQKQGRQSGVRGFRQETPRAQE